MASCRGQLRRRGFGCCCSASYSYDPRFGALVAFLVVGSLALRLWLKGAKRVGFLLAAFLVTQICLGVLNVVYLLPLVVAVGHNLTALALLLVLVMIYDTLRVRV